MLLTGHDGYLGSVMWPLLTAAGHEVVGLDTEFFHECTHGLPLEIPVTRRVDLRDLEDDAVADFDAVIHLAGLSNDPLGNLEPELTYEINVRAALDLARAARDSGVTRFLFASSCSIYGATGSDDLMTEDAPMRPVTPYAESKVRVEDGLNEMSEVGFAPVSLRNATAYGWSPRLRLDLVLNDLVASALLTGEVRVLSDGSPWRPLVHAVDIAGAFLAALESPIDTIRGQAFNIGFSGENYRVSELAEIVASVVAGSRVVVTGETGPDPRSYRVDFSRAARAFPAWTQVWNARSGAEQLNLEFRRNGLTPNDRDRFSRLRALTALRDAGMLTSSLRWAPQQV